MRVGDRVAVQWGLHGPKAAYSGNVGTISKETNGAFRIDFNYGRLMLLHFWWCPHELELLTEGKDL